MSRTLTYSAVAVVPLLILYEVGVWFLNVGPNAGVRNAADVALKEPFLMLPYGRHLMVGLILAGIFAIFRFETQPKRIRLVRPYFLLMLGESLVYASIFGAFINFLLRSFFRLAFLGTGMGALDVPTQLVLSLGAGLYEELVFRVILVSALFLFFRRVSGSQGAGVYVAAALLGAFVFSAYHYVGPYGDPFSLQTFLYRFVAGLVLNVLYLVRGFGITAYTHAFYDVLVTFVSPG